MKKSQTIYLQAIAALGAVFAGGSANAYATDYLDRSGWIWYASSTCAAESPDIAGLEGIHDNNINTCWHSNYHAESGTAERTNPHWIMIDRGSDTSEFDGLAFTPRQNTTNTACTSYYVYARSYDMRSTPASSVTAIVQALGAPDESGSWAESTDEKFIQFEKASTARYILFVNITSANSNSAACAEMNLFKGKPGSSGGSSGSFNAIKITPMVSATPHRIAINGNELTMSAGYGYIRMSNSDITIEYSPAEVARMNFENYDFGNESYIGPKKDVLTATFGLTASPAPGKTDHLGSVTLSGADGTAMRLNPEVNEPIRFMHGSTLMRAIEPSELPLLASGNSFIISDLPATADGNYSMRVPASLFIEPDGARSEATDFNWTLGESGAIESVAADCPTLTLSHSEGRLTVGGITDANTVSLINTAGVTVVTAAVSPSGTAVINTGALGRGVYLLNVNTTTLKIIL